MLIVNSETLKSMTLFLFSLSVFVNFLFDGNTYYLSVLFIIFYVCNEVLDNRLCDA